MTRDWTRSEEVGEAGGGGGGGGGTPGKVTRSEKIQRRAAGGAEPTADALSGMNVSGGGAPLPEGVKGQFESSLGADLSGVRVHTGGDSAEAARAMNAQAFAVGNDIHFGEGRFQPEDPFGMHLLAHEVAHTQQQAGGSGGGAQLKGLDVSMPGDASEVEADRAADAMVQGAPATVSSAGPSVQRSWLDWGDDEGDADASKYASAPVSAAPEKKKPQYLISHMGREFPWELIQPDAKGKKTLTAEVIQKWIDFYGLWVTGMPNVEDPRACKFNNTDSTVNSVVSIFNQQAKLANFRDDPYGSYEIISRDQKAKYEHNKVNWQLEYNGGGGGGLPHKPTPGSGHDEKEEHKTHLEIEWEFTPIPLPKVTWGGHVEAESPKHEIKGVFTSKVKEIGGWKAELSGAVVVDLEAGKPPKVGTEVEGKLSRDFLAKHVELELVGKMTVETTEKLNKGESLKGHLQSDPIHVKPSAELNLVYAIPGLKGMVEVKGGVSADPEGIGLGAAFVVKWK